MNGTYPSSNDAAAAFGSFLGGAILCYILFLLLLVVVMIWIYYKIIDKTGNSGWLALLMLVPLVNLGLIIFLAFSDWPVLRENRDLRARLGLPPGYPLGGGYSGGAVAYTPPYQPQPTPPMPNPEIPPPGPPVAPYPPQPAPPGEPPGMPPATPPAEPPVMPPGEPPSTPQ